MNFQTPTKQWEKEYLAGVDNGFQHDYSDAFYRQNLGKMAVGINSQEPLIRAYWLGYQDGLEMKPEEVTSAQ